MSCTWAKCPTAYSTRRFRPVMIQLIDQSNPAQGLVYRCLGCLAEFISAPPLLDEHQCGKPDDDPKRGIRPYVRVAKVPVQIEAVNAQAAAAFIDAFAEKIEAAVSTATRKARRPSRGKKLPRRWLLPRRPRT
jgi:hypothetical protein